MNIYLCGMIGSGKTAIGLAISRRLQWPFFDLDQVMEEEAGKRIHDIVAQETWVGFREREYAICKRFSKMDYSVIALGGGTVRYEWNRDVLKGSGPIILLTAKLKVLAERVKKNDRPRVNPGVNLEQDLSLLWKRFKHLYYQAADFTYRTDQGKTVKQEADEIIKILERRKFLASRIER
ncbi:MAG TPA: shikimate kinase [Thermodesulfobacteriota bacterium]|nr:shikimate kinase [Thermodesulfobacteriota bacterium]